MKETAFDFQVWAFWLINLFSGGGGGVITAYSSTLIKSFGYTSEHAALLNMGAGPMAMAATIVCAYGVRYFGNRWAWIIAAALPTFLGSALMAWLPHANRSGLLAGIYLVNMLLGESPVIYAWAAANIAGHTKRAVAMTGLNAAFAIGNIIGPQTFRVKDAPEYQPAKITMVCFQCGTVATCVALFIHYRRLNSKRDRKTSVLDISERKAYAGLTDKENEFFRYLY